MKGARSDELSENNHSTLQVPSALQRFLKSFSLFFWFFQPPTLLFCTLFWLTLTALTEYVAETTELKAQIPQFTRS